MWVVVAPHLAPAAPPPPPRIPESKKNADGPKQSIGQSGKTSMTPDLKKNLNGPLSSPQVSKVTATASANHPNTLLKSFISTFQTAGLGEMIAPWMHLDANV